MFGEGGVSDLQGFFLNSYINTYMFWRKRHFIFLEFTFHSIAYVIDNVYLYVVTQFFAYPTVTLLMK